MIKDSVAKQLIKAVFACYCLVAITVTVLHMVQEYRHTKADIKKELMSYQKIFSPVLAQAMWDLDSEQLSAILDSMDEVPIISGVKIQESMEDENDFIGIGDIKHPDGRQLTVKKGVELNDRDNLTVDKRLFDYQFVVTYQYAKEIVELGKVTLYSSSDVVMERVGLGFSFLIFNALIKSIVLWLIIYYFAKKLIFKPLKAFSDEVKNIDTNKLSGVELTQFKPEDFELYELEKVFNKFILEMNYYQSEIVELNKSLELKVTERTGALEQQKTKAEEALNIKSEFLSTMSHEIRTPMNGVIGMLNILSDSNLDDQSKRNLQAAKTSANNLLVLINDILDISKIESGNLLLEKNEFVLEDEVNNILERFKIEACQKGLKFNVSLINMLSAIVVADRIRLGQVINNLVNNAIKFTSEGGVSICLELEQGAEKTRLLGNICDTGIGIAEKKADQLFDSFTQADASSTRNYGGTGLGLSIVKNICEKMGGNIWLEPSNETAGANFHFMVDIQVMEGSVTDPEMQEPVGGEDQQIECSKTLPKCRILLVEDNIINQMVAMDTLVSLNQEVHLAENGRIALDMLLEDQSYDVILMDCQMPVMDGYAATQAIRQGEAGALYQSIPIIAVTANAMKGDKEKCLDAGMSSYLSKPLDIERLKSTLAIYLPK